jgi:4-amino-4-deoxy-L-arabinose transferase-like glycosyltransferase
LTNTEPATEIPVPGADTSPAPAAATDGASQPAAIEATPRGNYRLGAPLLVVGSLATFFMMCLDEQLPCGPLWGGLTTLLAGCGVLELFGLLRARPDDASLTGLVFAPKPGEPLWMAPRVTLPAALAAFAIGAPIAGADLIAAPITLALLILLVPALRRPALFVFVVASLLLLPMLGSFGLWDPWETHYGEVAREILARDDWITLWWAQDEWFRSKPILIFWIEALSWGALGVPFGSDSDPNPEWAIRLPHYALTMCALLSCYAAMARVFGQRVAVIGSLVLATTPYFFLIAHQAITDMPFVTTMTVALALFAIAMEAGDETPRRYKLGPLLVSWHNLVLLAFVVVALPQALYLISRNVTFIVDDMGFWPHGDQFLYGSAGNADVPGNPVPSTRTPYLGALWYQPFAQGLLWLLGLWPLVRAITREQRISGLAMFGFYLFCSLSWMAKGIPGFALPALIAGTYLLATGRLGLLGAGRLRVGMGLLTIAVTGLPWYVAMYGRLGPFFTDRLLIHDHINRLAQGVHGDTGSIQYFLAQLGYGAFPWVALMPLGFAAWLYLTPETEAEGGGAQKRTALLLAIWAACAFVLFNAMITKFHHYIFPAVPPLALLVGLVLDRVLGEREQEGAAPAWLSVLLCTLAPAFLVLGVAGLYGDVRGVVPEDVVDQARRASWVVDNPWETSVCVLLITIGLALCFFAARGLRERGAPPLALSVGLIAASALLAFVGRDFSWVTSEHPTGSERLIQLFIYNYGRPFPEHLDYRPILAGFALVSCAALVVAALPRLRTLGVYGLLATAFWFSAWALNLYMIDLSPHWGQRELVKRYYEKRSGPNEPLIAWQMNWKGENIYSGNRVHVFVQLDNKAMNGWMDKHGGTTAYFLLEHSRLSSFKRMMGRRSVDELSTARENNKFVLVRSRI